MYAGATVGNRGVDDHRQGLGKLAFFVAQGSSIECLGMGKSNCSPTWPEYKEVCSDRAVSSRKQSMNHGEGVPKEYTFGPSWMDDRHGVDCPVRCGDRR